jgi:hypothetical protein
MIGRQVTDKATAMVVDQCMAWYPHMLLSEKDMHWMPGNFGISIVMNEHDLVTTERKKWLDIQYFLQVT